MSDLNEFANVSKKFCTLLKARSEENDRFGEDQILIAMLKDEKIGKALAEELLCNVKSMALSIIKKSLPKGSFDDDLLNCLIGLNGDVNVFTTDGPPQILCESSITVNSHSLIQLRDQLSKLIKDTGHMDEDIFDNFEDESCSDLDQTYIHESENNTNFCKQKAREQIGDSHVDPGATTSNDYDQS